MDQGIDGTTSRRPLRTTVMAVGDLGHRSLDFEWPAKSAPGSAGRSHGTGRVDSGHAGRQRSALREGDSGLWDARAGRASPALVWESSGRSPAASTTRRARRLGPSTRRALTYSKILRSGWGDRAQQRGAVEASPGSDAGAHTQRRPGELGDDNVGRTVGGANYASGRLRGWGGQEELFLSRDGGSRASSKRAGARAPGARQAQSVGKACSSRYREQAGRENRHWDKTGRG